MDGASLVPRHSLMTRDNDDDDVTVVNCVFAIVRLAFLLCAYIVKCTIKSANAKAGKRVHYSTE